MTNLREWLGHFGIDFSAVLGTAAIVLAGSVVILFVTRFLHGFMRRLESHVRIPTETALLIIRVAGTALWVLLGALVINFWGISISGFWAFVASAATVVGVGFLATWTMISNATANLFIIIWRPFRLGETVELLPENVKGRVIDRSLMFTALREERGAILQVPNNLFFQKMFRVSDTSEQYPFEFLGQTDEAPSRMGTRQDERLPARSEGRPAVAERRN